MIARVRPVKPRLSPSERRARLLLAATRVLLRRGAGGTRISDVVREARVSRGTFYRHFHSKRGLLGVLARDLVDRLRPAFAPPAAVRTREEFLAAVEALHRATLEAFLAERAAARLLFAAGTAFDPGVLLAIATWEDGWRRLASAVVARAREASLVRTDGDLALATDCWLGALLRVAKARVLRAREPAGASRLASALARLAVASVSA